jgi:hypothetical protein
MLQGRYCLDRQPKKQTLRRFAWQKHVILYVVLFLLICNLLSSTSAYAKTQAFNSPLQTQKHTSATSWLPSTPPNWPVVVDEHTTLQQRQVTRGVTISGDVLQTVAVRSRPASSILISQILMYVLASSRHTILFSARASP